MYESEALLNQYLDFHYNSEDPNYLPRHQPDAQLLAYPRRCAERLIQHSSLSGRALDLGCAVGASSFSLRSHFQEVVGIDFSHNFINAASQIAMHGRFRSSECSVQLPSDLRKLTPVFEQGDACDLREDLGIFDGILLANLLCRLPEPQACLERLKTLTRPGSVIVLTTPCSWDEAFTPREKWIYPTFEGLQEHVGSWCELVEHSDMPFLLRDHERRAQYTVAEATVWKVK